MGRRRWRNVREWGEDLEQRLQASPKRNWLITLAVLIALALWFGYSLFSPRPNRSDMDIGEDLDRQESRRAFQEWCWREQNRDEAVRKVCEASEEARVVMKELHQRIREQSPPK